MKNSAYQEAQRVIERESVIRLSQRDARKVLSLLDHPPKPNKRLKAAVKAQNLVLFPCRPTNSKSPCR